MRKIKLILNKPLVLTMTAALLCVPLANSHAQGNPFNDLIGFYEVFNSNEPEHARASYALTMTRHAPEFGILFHIAKGQHRHHGMSCSETQQFSVGMGGPMLRCDQEIPTNELNVFGITIPPQDPKPKEFLSVADGASQFCEDKGLSMPSAQCNNEGFDTCTCYEIRWVCDDTNQNGVIDYDDDDCPSFPPTRGSGSGGQH